MLYYPDRKTIDWDGIWTLVLALFIILVSFGSLLFIAFLTAVLTGRKSNCSADESNCLLVFGKRLVDQGIDVEYQARLDKTLELLKTEPNRLVIILGGPSQEGEISEAEAGLNYLNSQGVEPQTEIILEKQSQNTLQNLRQARDLLKAKQIYSTALISNQYHLARCHLIADSLGLAHCLIPAKPIDTNSLQMAGKLLFEALYILWFHTGKTWARITGNGRMLKRVT
jgi:uncharacterized SAM-binding protein YcdF (DUF218 family)